MSEAIHVNRGETGFMLLCDSSEQGADPEQDKRLGSECISNFSIFIF